MSAKQSKPDDSLSLEELEAALSKLEAEKSRRLTAKQAKGEMICLVIADEGQDLAEQKRSVHAEHLRLHPEDTGKGVDWIELAIIETPIRDESRRWDELPAPEPAPAPECVPSTPFFVTTALCSEELPGGQIVEGLYGLAGNTVHVSTPTGKFVGKAPKGSDALATARQILRGATKGAAKWLRAALPSKSIV